MLRKTREFAAILAVALLVLSYAIKVTPSIWDHRYNVNDPVPFYANKVGPFHLNPSETYAYYDLPFCSPDHAVETKWSLGDMLNGDHFVSGPYKLEFRVDKDFEVVCTKTLTKEEIKKFQYAIANSYGYQMCYDDLPISGKIGRVDYYNSTLGDLKHRSHLEIFLDHSQFRSFYGRVDYNAKREDYKYQLFSHIDFQISYNNDSVIWITALVDRFSDYTVELTEDKEVEVMFSYSARWFKTNDSFETRMYEYSSSGERNCSSAMGSRFIVLMFLSYLVVFCVWVLQEKHNNYDRKIVEKHDETELKNIAGDVICCPKHKSLFAAAIGCGTQLIVLMFLTLVLGVLGVSPPYRQGTLRTGLVVTYVITSNIAGYASTSLYSQLQGTNWVQNILLTGSLFSVPLFITFAIANSVAATYRVTSALSFGTILVLLCIWLFGALPLLLLGGISAKNKVYEANVTRINTTCPPKDSRLPWYRGFLVQMCLAGMFSFGVMHTHFFYLLDRIWGQNMHFGGYIYPLYPILLVLATVTVMVTGTMTVAFSYSQHSNENHVWGWRSFLYGGSTGFYVFGYCLYFYHKCTNLSGVLQTVFFFGYMGCVSYGIFLMLGTVGFYASLLFVRYVHETTKCE